MSISVDCSAPLTLSSLCITGKENYTSTADIVTSVNWSI